MVSIAVIVVAQLIHQTSATRLYHVVIVERLATHQQVVTRPKLVAYAKSLDTLLSSVLRHHAPVVRQLAKLTTIVVAKSFVIFVMSRDMVLSIVRNVLI